MSFEDTPFFPPAEKEEPQQNPIYYDKSSTPTMRWIVGIFLSLVFVTLLVSVILAIVQTVKSNSMFALLLVSLIAFAQVQFFLVFFVYKGKMPRTYLWSVFVVGIFVIVECICTVIVLYSDFTER